MYDYNYEFAFFNAEYMYIYIIMPAALCSAESCINNAQSSCIIAQCHVYNICHLPHSTFSNYRCTYMHDERYWNNYSSPKIVT